MDDYDTKNGEVRIMEYGTMARTVTIDREVPVLYDKKERKSEDFLSFFMGRCL